MKRTVIIALLLLVALVAFYAQRRSYSNQEHERFQAGLWRLKHLDATFNEDLLRARFSLLESYDGFQRYLQEMDRLTADLHSPPRFVGDGGRTDLSRAAETFAATQRERRQLLERFKSRNAIQANSRRYFPVAVGELASRLGDAPADRDLHAIVQELTRVVLAHVTSTEELPDAALAGPNRLLGWAAQHPAHAEAGFVSSLAQHARQLLTGKSELDAITRQLLALPTAVGIERLSQLYEKELATALSRTQQYRTLLYGIGGLLVVVIGYALWAQRDANRRLEVRVTERTGQLRSEVEERTRTEGALQASEGFLNSLVQNLPIFIFRKDRAGRLTFANQRFCERQGRPCDQLIGKTAFDLLPPGEAERQQQLDERIMASGTAYEATEEETKIGGQPRFFHLIKVPVFDAAGQCVGVQGMFLDVTERKQAEAELEQVHRQLVDASRQAGMAEIATGVLHNVGNVLNSVNVSATLVTDHVRHTKAASVAKLAAMFRQHKNDLPGFLTKDPRGQLVADYLDTLTEALAAEQQTVIAELEQLRKNIDHIKDIVAIQQSYACTSGVIESVPLPDLVEDALRMNASSLARHDVELVRDYQVRPTISTDKHKVVQILVNLVRNAKLACDESGRADKQITVRIASHPCGVGIAVSDNGVGIPAENLTRIFAHGFTTRKTGHGFGLHSGALAAQQLGGVLSVHSDGLGRGATFTLELPFKPEATS
jgi:PAS domain S-box-containing protein